MSEIVVREGRELAERVARPLGLSAQPTLRLALGYRDPKKRNAPVKTDYFVAPRGQDGQYGRAADRFHKVYGEKPMRVDILLPRRFEMALDIRWKAFAGGSDDLGGVMTAIGETNWALDGRDPLDRKVPTADVLTVWEKDGSVVEKEISGWNDPLVEELGLELRTRLLFHIPTVLGIGGWAECSTAGRKSRDNLWRHLREWYGWFGEDVATIMRPMLVLQRAMARPLLPVRGEFDEDGNQVMRRARTKYWALQLFNPDTSIETMLERKRQLPQFQGQEFPELEAAAIEMAMSLPPPVEEPVRTLEDPSSFDRPTDPQMARILSLEAVVDERVRRSLLHGAFDVQHVEELDEEDAARYEEALRMSVPDSVEDEVIEDADVEVIE